MKHGRFLLIVVLLTIIQVTALGYLKIFGVKPDLLLAGVIWATLYFTPRWALLYAFFIGLLKDTFSATSFALNIWLFPLWAILIIRLSRKIIIEHNYTYALLAFIVSLAHSVLTGLLLGFLGNLLPWGAWLRILFFGSLYNAATAVILINLLKKIFPQKS